MAKLTLNSALHDIRGKIDNWVYRRLGDRQVISRPPVQSGPPTAGQLAVRDRFRLAAVYARSVLADPVLRPRYESAARARGSSAFVAAMTDYLRPPAIESIDVSGYHGVAGDPIRVVATDDFSVESVSVVLRNAAGDILEQGPAALAGGAWAYPSTGPVALGETVTIEASARDLPGNQGAKSVPCVIG
jgi:hypothetical protein